MSMARWECVARERIRAGLARLDGLRTDRGLPTAQRRYLRRYVAYMLGEVPEPPSPPAGMSECTRLWLEALACRVLKVS